MIHTKLIRMKNTKIEYSILESPGLFCNIIINRMMKNVALNNMDRVVGFQSYFTVF